MSVPKHIIYGLVDPRTLMVRYVGLSSSGLSRAHRHRLPSVLGAEDTHKTRWIRGLLAAGLDYQVITLAPSSRERLVGDEQWWIAYARASGWPLTNSTDGGEGLLNPTEETRARMRAARVGLKIGPPSKETRDKIGAANRGKTPSAELRALWSLQRTGSTHTAEARAKIAAASRGRRMSDKARAALAKLNANRIVSEETREKLRIAKLGYVPSAEARRKNGDSHRGTKRSEETKARMREAWIRRRERIQQGASK